VGVAEGAEPDDGELAAGVVRVGAVFEPAVCFVAERRWDLTGLELVAGALLRRTGLPAAAG
jgi:hypothetical protein